MFRLFASHRQAEERKDFYYKKSLRSSASRPPNLPPTFPSVNFNPNCCNYKHNILSAMTVASTLLTFPNSLAQTLFILFCNRTLLIPCSPLGHQGGAQSTTGPIFGLRPVIQDVPLFDSGSTCTSTAPLLTLLRL
jgi:hypothetical protein